MCIKFYDLKRKLIFTFLYLTFLCVMYYYKVPCIFISLFSIPCPGCGLSRALISAFRFDFGSAFMYHFMFWAVPLMYLYFLCDGRLFVNKKVDIAIWVVIISGFLLNWVLKILGVL